MVRCRSLNVFIYAYFTGCFFRFFSLFKAEKTIGRYVSWQKSSGSANVSQRCDLASVVLEQLRSMPAEERRRGPNRRISNSTWSVNKSPAFPL